jgi:hypothetical protein
MTGAQEDLTSRDQVELFPATFPIGIDGTGRPVLVYVATKSWTEDFRLFLERHLPLLGVTPTWTLRIVFAPSVQRAVPDYQRAVYDEMESRLDAQMINDLQ